MSEPVTIPIAMQWNIKRLNVLHLVLVDLLVMFNLVSFPVILLLLYKNLL